MGRLKFTMNKKEKEGKIYAANPIDISVGSKLREKRRGAGMSQDQLAQRVGLTFQQIQKYEKGANRISCSKIYQFAEVLNVPVSHFFEGLEAKYVPKDSYNYQFADNESEDQEKYHSDIEKTQLHDLTAMFLKLKNRELREHVLNLVSCLSRITLQ